ncbi:MAG TPA: lipocalin-like domain-containing protein [Steroidobacteraceae bacterium]|nr:lipocalin-like domain-containing protein [Steroidobacteraceae bacterium]
MSKLPGWTLVVALVLVMTAAEPADIGTRLVGCWRLVSYEGKSADGRITLDYGPTPHGRLMYDASGHMSVHLLTPDRKKFASGDFLRPTPEELREAFDGYFGYYGRYTVDEKAGIVTHHVEGAAYPNYIGTGQRRLFKLEGDRLILKTPPERAAGNDVIYSIVWQREK